eukprot:3184535-Alexandrium_andersonii.AAC.1
MRSPPSRRPWIDPRRAPLARAGGWRRRPLGQGATVVATPPRTLPARWVAAARVAPATAGPVAPQGAQTRR